MTHALLATAVAIAAALLPEAASACTMCMAGQGGGTIRAFAIGSIALSVTPLVAIGAAVWYLRRRARQLAAESAAHTPKPGPLSRSPSVG
jgi:hypothetical protein